MDEEVEELAHAVIGAAIEVHRILGPGLAEVVYEEALCIELTVRGIPFARQPVITMSYKGRSVGESRLDLLVGNMLVVELKSVEALLPVHKAQLVAYLKITNNKLGLLINFNVPYLKEGLKRIIL
ncbi:MAG TPA: GxxExxY protein [Chloroflexia bacterium]|nr:GxxExxY protein [Chloroflexia bacterium]